MKKASILFIIVGSLVGIGIILSFVGNQIVFQHLTNGNGLVSLGHDLEINVELDPQNNENGIYAVQIIDYDDNQITVKVLDPFDTQIVFETMNEDVFEGNFEIATAGSYKLVIENNNEKEFQVFGVIGPEPDVGAKSLAFVSLYVLIVGLIGMAGVGVYAIRNRKR